MSAKKKLKINLGTFDLVKGLAMLNVFVVHTIWRYNMEQSFFLKLFLIPLTVTSGIMPLFFLISGFGFKPKSTGKMFKKTFSELIVPYLWVALAYTVLYPVIHTLFGKPWNESVTEMIRYVLSFVLGVPDSGKNILGYTLSGNSATWFLLATFVSFNILNQVMRIQKPVLQWVAVGAIMTAGYFLLQNGISYFCIPQGMIALGYSYIGHMAKKHKWLEKLWANVWAYVILLPISLAQIKWGYFDLCNGHFNHVIVDYLGAGCLALLIILVGITIGNLEWRILDWIKQIGIYTYWIICIHSFEMLGIPWYRLAEAMPNSHAYALIIEIILKALLMTAVCSGLKKISKIRYRRRMKARA